MDLPWKKNDKKSKADAAEATSGASAVSEPKATAGDSQQPAKKHSGAFTPKKGRPTPKRNEVERERGIRRGPVEAPLTAKEARQRRKELKASMSKEELKATKARERAERREQRRIADERMAAGDPRYMLHVTRALSASSSATGSTLAASSPTCSCRSLWFCSWS